MKNRKLLKELVPVLALIIFIIVVLVLCAVSAGKKKRAAQEMAAAETVEEGSGPSEARGGENADETSAGDETSPAQELPEEIRETIEVEEEVESFPEEDASGEGSPQSGSGTGGPESGTSGTQSGPQSGAGTSGAQSGSGTSATQSGAGTSGAQSGNGTSGTQSGSGTGPSGAQSGTGTSGKPSGTAVSSNRIVTVKKTNIEMLAEMMDYWSKDNVEAIEDLSSLAHYRAMSAALPGPANFYYYGDRNADGKPEGTGIAVYGGDQYYYGEWKNGAREGEGMWLKMYYEPWNAPAGTVSGASPETGSALISHSYRGGWKNNLPSGEGHEQYDIDVSLAGKNTRYVQNVMGNFQNGLYHGEMYLLTIGSDGNVQEWRGEAKQGVFAAFDGRDQEGRVPICQGVQDADSHLWIKPLENKDLGVKALLGQKDGLTF